MDQADRAPTGLARRRHRISDRDTEQRMLQAAMDMLSDTGLTVSLEHLSLEDVIREARVSRSAVYRRWPYKDLFFSDLLKQLAHTTAAGALPEDTAAAQWIRQFMHDHLDWLNTPERRHQLVLELLRQAGLAHFEFFHQSTAWRTHIALQATFLSLPAGDERDEIQAALAWSERSRISQIAANYKHLTELLGYRLRPELGASFQTLAEMLNATMRGLVLTAPTVTQVAEQRLHASPFNSTEQAEWSQPALAIASIALSFLEPDPNIAWDDERLAAVRQALQSQDRASD